jgi:hypothetical protein
LLLLPLLLPLLLLLLSLLLLLASAPCCAGCRMADVTATRTAACITPRAAMMTETSGGSGEEKSRRTLTA